MSNHEEIIQLLQKVKENAYNVELFPWVIETYKKVCPSDLWSPHYNGTVRQIMKEHPDYEQSRCELQYVLEHLAQNAEATSDGNEMEDETIHAMYNCDNSSDDKCIDEDEVYVHDENVVAIVRDNEGTDDASNFEDNYLSKVLIPDKDYFDLVDLQYSQNFRSNYYINSRDGEIHASKRGNLYCKGHQIQGDLQCRFNLSYRLNTVDSDKVLLNSWCICSSNLVHNNHCPFFTARKEALKLGNNDEKSGEDIIDIGIKRLDVTKHKGALVNYAEWLATCKGIVALDRFKLYEKLKEIIVVDREIKSTCTFTRFIPDKNVGTALQEIVRSVLGADSSMVSVNDVISFIEKNREDYDYLLDCDDNGDAGLSKSIIIFREKSIQQFRKYNSVLGFDSTFKKNNEKYPLFIVAGLNGENKIFIVCFALMHDSTERSFNGVMKAMRRKLTYPDGRPILFDVALSDEEVPTIFILYHSLSFKY